MGSRNKVRRSSKHENKVRWLAENETSLLAQFPGTWIAVSDGGLVGTGETAAAAQSDAETHGCADVLVTFVTPADLQESLVVRAFRVQS